MSENILKVTFSHGKGHILNHDALVSILLVCQVESVATPGLDLDRSHVLFLLASLVPTSHASDICLFSDIVFHPWKKDETGNQSRVILYTITLTNPLAPKTATVTETQVS